MLYSLLGGTLSLLIALTVASIDPPLKVTTRHSAFYVVDQQYYGDRWDYPARTVFDLNTDNITAPPEPGARRFRDSDAMARWSDADPAHRHLLHWNELPRWVRRQDRLNASPSRRFFAYGWPFRCVQFSSECGSPGTKSGVDHDLLVYDLKPLGLDNKLRIPTGIIAAGLFADAAVNGVAPGLILAAIGLIRERRRARKGLCPKCAYDLRHDFASGCPECGWGREGVSREPA